jgi:S1-C subfamily serine protease
VDRSEGDDDELYPDAPVPAHERGWRHPSEMGQAAWANSEPPLTIGRGLSAATGAMGALLAVAVLWAVVPTHAGRGVGVSAVATTTAEATTPGSSTVQPPSTTALTLVDTTGGTGTTPTTATTASPSTTLAPSTTRPATSTTAAVTTTADVEHPSSATYQIEQATPRLPNALAVAISDGTLVLTTASAVSRGDNVALLTDNGDYEPAHVLMIDTIDDLAVLSAEQPTSTPPLRIADTMVKGDVLTFYDDQHSAVVVGDDGSVQPPWPLDRLREGTPVLNQRGELVALCTRGNDGMRLVMLSKLDSLRSTLAAEAASRSVWMGVTFGQRPDSLRIQAVAAMGPAANAGVHAGDVIVAVDGRAVSSRAAFAAALHVHHPGDTIALSVRSADDSEREVTVLLGAPPAD